MIEYFTDSNIDDRIVRKAAKILTDGGIVAYPTDSSWSIGCSAKNKQAVEKLKKIKGEMADFPMTVICSNISQISTIAELDNDSFKLIRKNVPGPFIFILNATYNIEKIIGQKRAEVGVRIPRTKIIHHVIDEIGSPLFAVSASKKMIDPDKYEHYYKEESMFGYGCELEDIRGIDLILDNGKELVRNTSTVIRLTDDEPEIIRQGEEELEW